jgi:hypothetical protein
MIGRVDSKGGSLCLARAYHMIHQYMCLSDISSMRHQLTTRLRPLRLLRASQQHQQTVATRSNTADSNEVYIEAGLHQRHAGIFHVSKGRANRRDDETVRAIVDAVRLFGYARSEELR